MDSIIEPWIAIFVIRDSLLTFIIAGPTCWWHTFITFICRSFDLYYSRSYMLMMYIHHSHYQNTSPQLHNGDLLACVDVAEVSTRLSPICCERLVAANAVSVIFRLIRSCNRSLPHMEIIKHSMAILINLAKVRTTHPLQTNRKGSCRKGRVGATRGVVNLQITGERWSEVSSGVHAKITEIQPIRTSIVLFIIWIKQFFV